MSKDTHELTLEAAKYVASRLLPEDLRELEEGYGYTSLEMALEAPSLGSGVSFTMPNGETAGIGGVTPNHKVWMLCTDAVLTHPIAFVRLAKSYLHSLDNPYLWNYVDKRNVRHIKLLKYLGFTFLREVPFGPNNLPFIEFIRLNVRTHLSGSRDC